MAHRGVAADDPRNAGIIAYFRPKAVTRESLLFTLTEMSGGTPTPDLQARVEKAMQALARGPIRPDPPLSQPLEAVVDPFYGLGTHPDIIEAMWKLDGALPQRCRWVFWGKPSLVHPDTGIVFAVGFGTIGMVLRSPPQLLARSAPRLATVIKKARGQAFDISAAGSEWRFVVDLAAAAEWCRAAYDFAGETAQ